jgi:hypothetical protein
VSEGHYGAAQDMAVNQRNAKSDVPAKQAFVEYLLSKMQFDEARITRNPADITARKGKQVSTLR